MAKELKTIAKIVIDDSIAPEKRERTVILHEKDHENDNVTVRSLTIICSKNEADLFKTLFPEAIVETKTEEDAAIEKKRKEIEAENAKIEAERKAKIEAEKKAKADAEARKQREAEERRKAEAEKRAKAEAELKAKQEAEERAKKEKEEKLRAEIEAKMRAEQEARMAEEAAKKAEEEAKAKQEAEIEARIRAEVEAKIRSEYENRAGNANVEKAEEKPAVEEKGDLFAEAGFEKVKEKVAEKIEEVSQKTAEAVKKVKDGYFLRQADGTLSKVENGIVKVFTTDGWEQDKEGTVLDALIENIADFKELTKESVNTLLKNHGFDEE